MKFQQFQIGGPNNQTIIGLDAQGAVWFNRGGVERSEWEQLHLTDDGLSVRFRSIVLWGHVKQMLEAIDERGRVWSFDGVLHPSVIEEGGGLGSWVPAEGGCTQFHGRDVPPELIHFVDGCHANGNMMLFALDREGLIWCFDADVADEWFRLPFELTQQQEKHGYDA